MPGPPPGDNTKTFFRHPARYLYRKLVIFMSGLGTGRSENGDARSDLSERFETLHEFGHNLKDLPAAVGARLRPVAEALGW